MIIDLDNKENSRPAQAWFQSSHEGNILFVVFYTLACRWSKCLGCNLYSKMSETHVGYADIIDQVNYIFANERVIKARNSIRKVIVSNNGSVLDHKTFPVTSLLFLIAKIKTFFGQLSVVTLETRPEYVELSTIEIISKALSEGEHPVTLEISIGFEIFNDHFRNNVFNKGLLINEFQKFIEKVSQHGCRLKCYFMQKPVVAMSDAEAVLDIKNAIDYLDYISRHYSIDINMHLNPTYVAVGTMLSDAFSRGEYSPPRLRDVAEAVRHAKGKQLSVFIGLNDEGLSVEGGSFIRPGDQSLVKMLENFNITQNYDMLDWIIVDDQKKHCMNKNEILNDSRFI